MKRIAFYGGSFDPVHKGHLKIAEKLTELFRLDEFFFVPAFHAPHKKRKKPTSAFHRFVMLALATNDEPKIKISTVELDAPDAPYTVQTQAKVLKEMPDAEIFFVIGADSWAEIDTWREWEKVLTQTNIIVVTRPNYEIEFTHIPAEIVERIIDLRVPGSKFQVPSEDEKPGTWNLEPGTKIFITDAVQMDVSATEIRRKIREGEKDWQASVNEKVADYIEKYELY